MSCPFSSDPVWSQILSRPFLNPTLSQILSRSKSYPVPNSNLSQTVSCLRIPTLSQILFHPKSHLAWPVLTLVLIQVLSRSKSRPFANPTLIQILPRPESHLDLNPAPFRIPSSPKSCPLSRIPHPALSQILSVLNFFLLQIQSRSKPCLVPYLNPTLPHLSQILFRPESHLVPNPILYWILPHLQLSPVSNPASNFKRPFCFGSCPKS